MLVLKKAGLVYLANPKTATQSIRTMLEPFGKQTPDDAVGKHINVGTYYERYAAQVERKLGAAPQTVAVMREPLDHLFSWYRYRSRDALNGHPNSTAGKTFADFIEAWLLPNPPAFARVGWQLRFMGFESDGPRVDFIFDYRRLELFVAFMSERLDRNLKLIHRNASPLADEAELPPALLKRLHDERGGDFDLYARVADEGVLETGAVNAEPSNSEH